MHACASKFQSFLGPGTLPTFLKIKKRLEKNVKNVKKRDQNKKNAKTFLTSMQETITFSGFSPK